MSEAQDGAPPRPRTGRRTALLAVAFGAGALGAFIASRKYAIEPAADEAVRLLYEQSYPDPDGAPYALSSLRGRVAVINFWATWCPPCVEEMPELADLHREFSPRGVTIVGIGIDSAANVRRFVEKTPMPYPLVVAGAAGSELVRQFGNKSGALPFTAVVGRNGEVVDRILGRFDLARLRESMVRAAGA